MGQDHTRGEHTAGLKQPRTHTQHRAQISGLQCPVKRPNQ